MIRKACGYILTSLILLAAVSGCAGLQGKSGVSAYPSETESRLKDANIALDAANEQSSAFYGQLDSTLQAIKEFQGRPGWKEFEQILLDYPPLRDPDNATGITEDMKTKLSAWSDKWKASWEKTLDEYYSLVDRCTILEAKRLAAREKILVVQAKFLAAVMVEASAGHEKQGREIFSVVDALDKSNAELDSYRTDELGLYGAGR